MQKLHSAPHESQAMTLKQAVSPTNHFMVKYMSQLTLDSQSPSLPLYSHSHLPSNRKGPSSDKSSWRIFLGDETRLWCLGKEPKERKRRRAVQNIHRRTLFRWWSLVWILIVWSLGEVEVLCSPCWEFCRLVIMWWGCVPPEGGESSDRSDRCVKGMALKMTRPGCVIWVWDIDSAANTTMTKQDAQTLRWNFVDNSGLGEEREKNFMGQISGNLYLVSCRLARSDDYWFLWVKDFRMRSNFRSPCRPEQWIFFI